jgi:hypothetical protein
MRSLDRIDFNGFYCLSARVPCHSGQYSLVWGNEIERRYFCLDINTGERMSSLCKNKKK